MLDLLYHLYERIVKYKLTYFSGAIIELKKINILAKQMKVCDAKL